HPLGTSSKFGAGLFLLVQVIILLDFTHTWNDAWVVKDEQKWYIALLVVSVGCYLAAFVFSGILFIWFNPSGHDCGLNVFFTVMTMILAFSFGIIALHPRVNGSLLPASVISVYCAYLCYTGLSGEPRDYACNDHHYKSSAVSTSTLITESPDLIDVGWTLVWVRICTEWVTAGLYIWTLVAPLILPDREFF
ncbi:serine incorporator 1-like, partial [Hibiscus syriacus]|uniref:serine incorporator 1-like n=1 Tax=Hibiscus syriacus TaxID=106335 RepID=UPI001923F466